MVKSLQKSANLPRELQLPHPGILDLENFNRHYELHCYEPSDDLKPFLVHIWTQRIKHPDAPAYQPVEVLSGPNMYLFFTPDSAFVHGIVGGRFRYRPKVSGTLAGVKFRPGAFRCFTGRSMASLADKTPAITEIFPDADEAFKRRLLAKDDPQIAASLEALLRAHCPLPNKNIELIADVLTLLDADKSLNTVEAVARRLGMSKRSLQQLFHTYVGVGLKWVIMRKRLLQALEQVQSLSRPTWLRASAEVGYSSQSHFVHEFKRTVGQSPTEYAHYVRSTRTRVA